LSAPDATPKPVLDLLERHAREIAQSTALNARFQLLGLDPVAAFEQSGAPIAR
jgi:hypothetical protein